jgi:hypothetical protein
MAQAIRDGRRSRRRPASASADTVAISVSCSPYRPSRRNASSPTSPVTGTRATPSFTGTTIVVAVRSSVRRDVHSQDHGSGGGPVTISHVRDSSATGAVTRTSTSPGTSNAHGPQRTDPQFDVQETTQRPSGSRSRAGGDVSARSRTRRTGAASSGASKSGLSSTTRARASPGGVRDGVQRTATG